MRVLLLILLLVIWEAAAGAPRSPVDPAVGAMGLAIGYGVLVGAARVWGGRVGAAEVETYNELGRRVDRFNVGMAVARAAVPAWFAVGVFGLGWRRVVDDLLRRWLGPTAVDVLVTPGVVVGVLPGLVAWAGLWWAQYPVDTAVREHGAMVQLEADLPVFSPPPFGSYFANRLRVQLLFTTVPVLLILAARDGATLGVAAITRGGRLPWLAGDVAESIVSVVTTVLVLLIAPVVLVRVLSTRRLPDGRLSAKLDEVLRLAGVRCRAVLLWDTHHNLGNAAVMGLLRPVRYVLFTDLLVQSMTDEHLQAVFAHELGHVRHRHLAWFVGVLGTGMAALSAGADYAVNHLHTHSATGAVAVSSALLVASVAVLWLGYGTLSRWFERQADVYAVRLMDRATPGRGPMAFGGALYRVAVVNNIAVTARNWTHGSIAKRLAFIDRLSVDPAVGPRFDRAGRRVRWGLVALMVVCGTAAALALR